MRVEGEFKTQLDLALKAFDEFEDIVVNKHLGAALYLGAQHFQQAVEMNVPVLTGNLRARIEIKKLKSMSQFQVDQDNPIKIRGEGKGTPSFIIGAGISGTVKKGMGRPGYYILQLERGYYAAKRRTRAKNASVEDKYGRNATYVEGKPFMERTFNETKDKVISVVVNSLQADARRLLASRARTAKP